MLTIHQSGFLYREIGTTDWKTVYNNNALTSASGNYTVNLSSLKPGTKYEYKAWMQVGSKDFYGSVKTFDTLTIPVGPGESTAAFGKVWAELPMATTNSSLTENATQCVKYITDKTKQDNGYYHRNYSICYDTVHHVPLWTAYPMHSYYTSGSASSETFYADPSFDTSVQPGSTYENYTRGHQLAKANRTVSTEARKQSNYYTNMTPQRSAVNSPTVSNLEAKERGAWMCADTLYMVTGCHFDDYNTTTTATASGDSNVYYVPTHYYKVMLRTKAGNTGKRVQDCTASELICAGYWIDHKNNTATLMSVSSIEALTGQTFFVNVPNAPKSTFTASDWE